MKAIQLVAHGRFGIRRKWLKGLALTVAALIALFALALAFENYRGKRAWEKCRRDLEAKGEKLDLSNFIPPPVPDEQNFAMTPLLAPLYDFKRDEKGAFHLSANAFAHLDQVLVWPGFLGGNWRRKEFADLEGLRTFLRELTNETALSASAYTGTGRPFHSSSYLPEPVSATGLPQQLSIQSNPYPAEASYSVEEQRLARQNLRQNRAIAAWLATPPAVSPAEDLLALLRQDATELEELRLALRRPYSRFNIRYEQGFDVLLPHLGQLKKFALTFRAKAIAELSVGNTDSALADTRAMLALANALKHEPLTLSVFVRFAIVQLAIQPVWEGLARQQWSAEQMAVLQSSFEQLNLIEDMARALRGQRAVDLHAIDAASRRSISENYFPAALGGWRSGWVRQNQVTYARLFQEFALPPFDPNNRVADVRMADELAQKYVRQPESFWCYTGVGQMLAGMYVGGRPSKPAEAQAAANLVVTACALERYHLARGEYPEVLAELAPDFVETLPNDPVNGQPLKYRRAVSSRFLLYSVGLDLKDDGGVMREPRPWQPPQLSSTRYGFPAPQPDGTAPTPLKEPLDWVWTYPEN